MVYVKWAFRTIVWLVVAAFLHYTLPQHDIVRITDTFERRIDFGENSIFWAAPDAGTQTGGANRDVFFIQTIRPNGKPMVYRNEDTSWGWPPYFKFDTNNLQTQAADLRSTSEAPKWVSVTHYGWRNEFLTIFPNAVGVKPVAGPDVTIVPWLNIVILVVLAAVFWAVRVRWLRFRRRRIDPVIAEAGEAWDDMGDRARQGRLARWWRGKGPGA